MFQPKLSPDLQKNYNPKWAKDPLNNKLTDVTESGEVVDYLPWDKGEPNGLHIQQCVALNLQTLKFRGNIPNPGEW